MNRISFAQAVRLITEGNLLIYPTETFYALGGNGFDQQVIKKVFHLKRRPFDKPLPLIVGDVEMCAKIARFEGDTLKRLSEYFWPGPLSVLVELNAGLSPLLKDAHGQGCLRVSSHPWARKLSLTARCPLLATSANLSGRQPQKDPFEVDMELLAHCPVLFSEEYMPHGGQPSTIVKPLAGLRVKIVRPGAVSVSALQSRGFSVV